MRQSIISILVVTLLVLVPVGIIGIINNHATPAQATVEPTVNCVDSIAEQNVRIRCTAAGVVVLNTSVNLPTVEVPGETVTIKVPLPGATETIRVPQPGPTKTVEIERPGATVTMTEPAQGQPTATVTQTTTAPSTPRQGGTTPGTIEPAPEDDVVVKIPETNLNTPEAVGIGTLVVAIMVGLILLGMYAGYYMGYKDSDKAEAKFLKSLLGR